MANQSWKHERLYTDGDRFFGKLEQAIDTATTSIDMEMYIFAGDSLGRSYVQRLIEAKRRGVEVRIIVDGVGSSGWRRTFGESLAAAGIPFKVYHELPWDRLLWRRTPGRCRLAISQLLFLINKRNHRKVVIIDGREVWTGSMNIAECHLQSVVGEQAWRDSGVCVQGEGVGEFREAFERIWQPALRHALFRDIQKPGTELVQLNRSLFRRHQNYNRLRSRIRKARERVFITTAYFVPRVTLLRELKRAAKRGIEVRLLLPARSDVVFMPWVEKAFYAELLENGVQIYEYQRSILHAKTMQIDDYACVGSTNLNHRSLIHDLEVDVVLTHPESKTELEQAFFDDLQHAKEISWEDLSRQSWYTRLAGRAMLLFRYWL